MNNIKKTGFCNLSATDEIKKFEKYFQTNNNIYINKEFNQELKDLVNIPKKKYPRLFLIIEITINSKDTGIEKSVLINTFKESMTEVFNEIHFRTNENIKEYCSVIFTNKNKTTMYSICNNINKENKGISAIIRDTKNLFKDLQDKSMLHFNKLGFQRGEEKDTRPINVARKQDKETIEKLELELKKRKDTNDDLHNKIKDSKDKEYSLLCSINQAKEDYIYKSFTLKQRKEHLKSQKNELFKKNSNIELKCTELENMYNKLEEYAQNINNYDLHTLENLSKKLNNEILETPIGEINHLEFINKCVVLHQIPSYSISLSQLEIFFDSLQRKNEILGEINPLEFINEYTMINQIPIDRITLSQLEIFFDSCQRKYAS